MAVDQSSILANYIAQLRANQNTYTPLTEAQMEAQAKRKYQSVYDQNRLSAQQQYDTAKLARDQALQTQLDQYALQREQSRENYQNAMADAVRSALGRGMQRSSYIGATVGNINLKGNEAQQAIMKNQEGTVRNYAEQSALAQNQLAAQMAQYDKNQLADQLAYQDELEQREYDRGLAAADRINQIAGDIYNAELYATEKGLFGYKRNNGKSSGSSGSGSSGSGSGNKKDPAGTKPDSTSGYDSLIEGANKKPYTGFIPTPGMTKKVNIILEKNKKG
ncbi:MAG: hypothetical protein J6A48_11530 [Clostridia bacterium]|nr:hypothetical protein [Clostridia bacterium]